MHVHSRAKTLLGLPLKEGFQSSLSSFACVTSINLLDPGLGYFNCSC